MGYKNNAFETNDIIIDDGEKIYNIKNKNGKVLGQFAFRPSDTNIIGRYEEVVNFFDNFKIAEETEEAAKEAEKTVAEKIDYLIDADASSAFFTILGPFSVLASGELFFENVVNQIGTVIEKTLSVRTKKMKKRMNKYVQKYHR